MWLPLLSVDLKHRTCQLILQKKQMYAVSAQNCNWSSAAMASYMQIPAKQRMETLLLRRERVTGRAIINRVDGFSLTGLLPEKK